MSCFGIPKSSLVHGMEKVVGSVEDKLITKGLNLVNNAVCEEAGGMVAGACQVGFGGPEDPAADLCSAVAAVAAARACPMALKQVEKAIGSQIVNDTNIGKARTDFNHSFSNGIVNSMCNGFDAACMGACKVTHSSAIEACNVGGVFSPKAKADCMKTAGNAYTGCMKTCSRI